MKPTRSHLRISVLIAVLLALPILSTGLSAEALDSEEKKTLYALGVAVGQNLAQLNLTAEELETVKQGLADMAMNVEPRSELGGPSFPGLDPGGSLTVAGV